MKNRKRTLCTILFTAAALCAVYVSLALYSYVQFGTPKPFSAIGGLAEVMFTDAEYAEIREYPQVIIAKPEASLDEYMEARGLTRDDEKQMGALCVFTDGNFEEIVMYSENGYFSIWRWQE